MVHTVATVSWNTDVGSHCNSSVFQSSLGSRFFFPAGSGYGGCLVPGENAIDR